MTTTNTKYFGDWSDHASMLRDFARGEWNSAKRDYDSREIPDFPTDEEVLFATYDTGEYEGQAHIFYMRDGKLYETSAGHCSCNGLEDNFTTGSEVTWKALDLRLKELDDRWGFLCKADQATRDAFRKLVTEQISSESVLRDFNGTSN